MENQNLEKTKIKTAKISLLVGIAIFIIKISAYIITGSSAIFSDAAESVIHILATTMVLYSIILSSRPPDRSHLYGHGNIEYFSAGIEGILIVIAAITIIYFAVQDIILESTPNKLDTGTYLVAFSGVINFILGYYIVKKGKVTNSLALIADGKHILTDSYTSFGVVIGLILVLFTDFYLLDPIIAIVVALNIIFTGYNLIRESVGGLMMETDDILLERITVSLKKIKKDYMIDIHQLRFWKSGGKVFIDFHLTLPYFFNIMKSHEIETEILNKLSNELKDVEIRTHFDYCESYLCPFCEYSECTVREKDFERSIEWNKQKLIGDPIINER